MDSVHRGSVPCVVETVLALIGLLSGEAYLLITSIPAVLAQIKSGKVRALGVSTAKRSSILPDVPTIDEAGVPGYNAASWYGLFSPAGVPPGALAILSKEILKIMRVPEVRDRFAADAFDPVGSTPEEFSQFIRDEISKWAKLIETAKIKAE